MKPQADSKLRGVAGRIGHRGWRIAATILALGWGPGAVGATTDETGSAPLAVLDHPATGRGSPCLVDHDVHQVAEIYRHTPQADLAAYVFHPPDWQPSDRRAAMGFFFGGGWRSGSPRQLLPQAEYFAAQGMLTVIFDYRVESRHGTLPDASVEDAKAAFQWLVTEADRLGIDREKIVVAGASAGAHLAAAIALLDEFNPPAASERAMPRPAALVLYNPPLELTGFERANRWPDSLDGRLSVLRFVDAATPPTILFFGEDDPLVAQGADFVAAMARVGRPYEMLIAPGEGHGFFNDEPWLSATVWEIEGFLAGRDLLTVKPVGAEGPETADLLRRY